MAWVSVIEKVEGKGKLQPTQVVARCKIFAPINGTPIVQIDTTGSFGRELPGKTSQTLQFGEEAARQLFDILRDTYGFR
jgi:hypothetical protein